MKIQKINIRRLSSVFLHEHTHFIASLTCGIAMGVLFSTRIATYQAHYFQEQAAQQQASSSISAAFSSARMRAAASLAASLVTAEPRPVEQSQEPEPLSFFDSSESSEPRPAVKKGNQISVRIEVPAVSSSVMASSRAPAPVTHAVRPVAQLVSETSSSEQAPAVQSSESSESPVVPMQSNSSAASSQAPVVAEPQPEPPQSSESSAPHSAPAGSSAPSLEGFPAFIHASQPVNRVPNWGAMSTPEEFKRTYSQLTDADFVAVPAYNLKTLTIPMKSLTGGSRVSPDDIPTVTAKLYYSTRYMGAYDLDAGEHSGNHPGVDLKLALGTPIGAIGGGRVYSVSSDARLGLHVVIEHRNESGQFFSVYAHLGSAKVSAGDTVKPGQTIGFVGLTGMTTMAHLHLEVHRGSLPAEPGMHAAAFTESAVINPMTFIYGNGKM